MIVSIVIETKWFSDLCTKSEFIDPIYTKSYNSVNDNALLVSQLNLVCGTEAIMPYETERNCSSWVNSNLVNCCEGRVEKLYARTLLSLRGSTKNTIPMQEGFQQQ